MHINRWYSHSSLRGRIQWRKGNSSSSCSSTRLHLLHHLLTNRSYKHIIRLLNKEYNQAIIIIITPRPTLYRTLTHSVAYTVLVLLASVVTEHVVGSKSVVVSVDGVASTEEDAATAAVAAVQPCVAAAVAASVVVVACDEDGDGTAWVVLPLPLLLLREWQVAVTSVIGEVQWEWSQSAVAAVAVFAGLQLVHVAAAFAAAPVVVLAVVVVELVAGLAVVAVVD